VFIDAIVVKIRDGQVANRPVYGAIGVTLEGGKDILRLWAGTGGESASLDPSGTGQARWTMRTKPALNAFAITFGDRFPSAEAYQRNRWKHPLNSLSPSAAAVYCAAMREVSALERLGSGTG
jgi:hypothetical protein